MSYDREYGSSSAFFGEEPDALLARHVGLLASGSKVLDVGAGQGRHALFLARRNVRVDALDPSQVGLEQLGQLAGNENLKIRTIVGSWEAWDPHPESYDAVLLFGILQLVAPSRFDPLIRRIGAWLRPAGLVFITAHTTEDAGCVARRAGLEGWSEVESNCYRSADGELRTYLEPGQLGSILVGFEAIELKEYLGPEHRHGEGLPERHARVDGVFRKR